MIDALQQQHDKSGKSKSVQHRSVSLRDLEEALRLRFGVDAHKENRLLFGRHVMEGNDPQLERYAEQTLRALREHMSAAHTLLYAAAATR